MSTNWVQEITHDIDFSGALGRWRTANTSSIFRIALLVTLTYALFIVWFAPHYFSFVQQRSGMRSGMLFNDPILAWLPSMDVSLPIVAILYPTALFAIGYYLLYPTLFVRALQAYLLMTTLRVVTIYLIPLEEPEGLIYMVDPVLKQIFYQGHVTKDLFFSGHVATFIVFGVYARTALLRRVFYLLGMIMAGLILLQHAHYTIDVVAAPFFAVGAARLVDMLNRRLAMDQH